MAWHKLITFYRKTIHLIRSIIKFHCFDISRGKAVLYWREIYESSAKLKGE